MKQNVNSYRAMAALTRGFFEAFAMGIIDCTYGGDDFAQKNSPQNIKKAMLEHYEKINESFFDIMFYIFTKLNYEDYEQARSLLANDFKGKQPDIFDLLRFACKTDNLYQAMVIEYKRNFEMLLSGKFSTIPEHIESYIHGNEISAINEPTAIRLMVRTLIKAYSAGIKTANTTKISFHQSTIMRLLVINVNLLINDAQMTSDQGSIEEVFADACGDEENFTALMQEMNIQYDLLAKEEGIIATDDTAN